MCNLELSEDMMNIVLEGLGELPAKRSFNVITEIVKQLNEKNNIAAQNIKS